MTRKLPVLGSVIGGVVAPLVALAQSTGSVTTGPLGIPAPAVGTAMLALLALVLAAGAMCVLRRRATRSIAAVAVLISMVGLVYGTTATVEVDGAECAQVTMHSYDPTVNTYLENTCTNLIRIIAIDAGCGGQEQVFGQLSAPPPPPCQVGQVLQSNEICELPNCIR